MAQIWQKIDARWHSCHSWQDRCRSMITAMTEITVLIVSALIVAAIVGTIVVTLREVFSDGGHHPRSPRSHVPDTFDPRYQKLA